MAKVIPFPLTRVAAPQQRRGPFAFQAFEEWQGGDKPQVRLLAASTALALVVAMALQLLGQ